MQFRLIYIMLLLLISWQGFSQAPAAYNNFLQHNRQLVFVRTVKPTDITGTMYLYERKRTRKNWKLVDSFPVTVGRTGLAWDETTTIPHPSVTTYKREGDGKSPAGLFQLGYVFSYHPVEKLKMPFKQVDGSDLCVDDSKSAYYNRPIDTDTIPNKDWNSFEYMHRQDAAYEYGVWVLYNSKNYTPGYGSCIFLHVWDNDHTPTVGCTAMSKENVLRLIHWLDQKKQPVLLQVTGG